MQLYQIKVLRVPLHFSLDRNPLFIYNAEIILIECRNAEQNLVDKTHFLFCAELLCPAFLEKL